MKTIASITAHAILSFAAASAFAHGDTKHGKPAAAKPLSTEEHAFGRQGDPATASRRIAIRMSDAMRFSPAEITVKQGETIRFVVTNGGTATHEMVIGTLDELKAHGELMNRFPNMEHDEPYMAHVAPGKSEEITWAFTKAGQFHFGCLVPGHFAAGMVGRIVVTSRQRTASRTAFSNSHSTTEHSMIKIAAPLLVSLVAAGPAFAQHPHHAPASQAGAPATTDGIVQKIDKSAGKITLKHGEIRNLGMPAMTMVFQVKEPALLDKVKAGEKVQFLAEQVAGGPFTVTSIEAAK